MIITRLAMAKLHLKRKGFILDFHHLLGTCGKLGNFLSENSIAQLAIGLKPLVGAVLRLNEAL